MTNKWIILERKEYHEDGIRWKAFPLIDDSMPLETLEIVRDDDRQKYWIVTEIPKWLAKNERENCSSVGDLIKEQKDLYNTHNNTYDMFPVGTHVQVITIGQDGYFFEGTETGKVVRNTGEYLGIFVEFDNPRRFNALMPIRDDSNKLQAEDDYIQREFNFEPSDLIVFKYMYDDVTSDNDLRGVNENEKENGKVGRGMAEGR